jgi:hypothetical protein
MNPLLIHCIYCIKNCSTQDRVWQLFVKYNNVFKGKDHELFISEALTQLDFLQLIVNDVNNS